MKFDEIEKYLEIKNETLIEAIKLVLKKEEEKIGMKNPVNIKEDLKKIFNQLGERYEARED